MQLVGGAGVEGPWRVGSWCGGGLNDTEILGRSTGVTAGAGLTRAESWGWLFRAGSAGGEGAGAVAVIGGAGAAGAVVVAAGLGGRELLGRHVVGSWSCCC